MVPCELTNIEEKQAFFNEEMRQNILGELDRNNYVLIEGKNFRIPDSLQQSFDQLANLFSELFLAEDNYTGDRFELVRHLDQGIFQISPNHEVSFHPRSVIHGGRFDVRNLNQNQFLWNLIQATSELLPEATENSCRSVRVSLTRHGSSCIKLLLHKDPGNFLLNDGPRLSKWVVQYNIHRSKEGISGGEILIAGQGKNIVAEKLLSERLDAYIVNNQAFFHGANPINIISGSGAVRDIVIMEFTT